MNGGCNSFDRLLSRVTIRSPQIQAGATRGCCIAGAWQAARFGRLAKSGRRIGTAAVYCKVIVGSLHSSRVGGSWISTTSPVKGGEAA